MSINSIDLDYEKSRLKSVYNIIETEINKRSNEIKAYREQIISTRKSMWEEAPSAPHKFEEIVDVQHYLDGLKHEWERYVFTNSLVKKLERIKLSPYFARIDFKETDSEEVEKIYIGISSLIDDKSREIYIYDWRAPISGIFYDYELGHASYMCPDGKIEGEVSLKRQFKISGSQIEYMFNSSIKIDDEILQEILSRNVDDRMRNIVTTIQKEQNQIIRDERNELLIVQGPAGSGKTSVALHRIAYLLYKYRDSKISSKNIIIFSPNQVFNDYISNVLPELGEENMVQTTFAEYAKLILGSSFRIEDFNDQMEYVLSRVNDRDYDIRTNGISFKSSMEYMDIIKKYLNYLENGGIIFGDITYRGITVMTKGELEGLFYKDYNSLPITKRLDRIRDRALSALEPYRKTRLKEIEEQIEVSGEHKGEVRSSSRLFTSKEFKEIRDRIHQMFSIDAYKVYMRLYEDKKLFSDLCSLNELPENFDQIREMTLDMLSRKKVLFEDLPPFLIIKLALEGTNSGEQIRHVLIDEAQDYSILQYELIKKLFGSSSITLLGDLNQSIHPFTGIGDYQNIIDSFEVQNSALLYLSKSYRSTKEIFEFSRAMLNNQGTVEAIDRRGEKPKVIRITQRSEIANAISDDIPKLISKGMKSIAIICKTEKNSQELYQTLKDKISGLNLITKKDDEFKKGVSVIPSYLAKGLEFDAVQIFNASNEEYNIENERKLFYTICSRALHELTIYYCNELTRFISDVPSSLYEMHSIEPVI